MTSYDLPKDPLRETPVVQGSNFEDLLAYYRSRLLPLKITPPNPRAGFRWWSDFAAGAGVSVVRAAYSSSWSYGSDNDTENLNLCFLNAGGSELTIGSRTFEQTTSRLAIYAQPMLRRQAVFVRNEGLTGATMRFDAGTVARLLVDMFDGAPLTSLNLTPTIDLSSHLGRTLQSIACALASGMRDEQLLLRSPKAMTLLTEAALRLILEEVPHRLSAKLEQQNGAVAPQQIKQAIDYMRANLHLPLTISDIAAAVGISSRSLQLGFRKHCETSPAYYLRGVRLDAVHSELSSPGNTLPVSEVALKWGFAHMGRFAAQYRRTFGVAPSETARRAGSSHVLRRQP
ncbi:helix-turn-helix transcriptional regulator [Bradyrhizobium manausense]|uniref:helix-turn-helix transcriptional regulator n=1 Tax=Bradyrhizobium manausense TaxID=989370 RepID=UPI002012DD8B|nr:AraC family transcriptional regulator [Bradyrhizobium manausense]